MSPTNRGGITLQKGAPTVPFISVSEFCRQYGISKQTVRQLMETDQDFPAVQVSAHRVRIATGALDRWVERRRAREWAIRANAGGEASHD